MLSKETFDSMVENYCCGNGSCNCTVPIAEHEQGPWTTVLNTDTMMYTTCSSCDSWVDFAKYGCTNSWAEVQADDYHFVCRGCMTVKYLQELVNELRYMILMMTGQGENEKSRGGENDESRGGETEESRGGENEDSRGSENEESSGNMREKAGKKKKDGKRKNVQQKEDKRVSEEGLSGGRMVKNQQRAQRKGEDCGSEEER